MQGKIPAIAIIVPVRNEALQIDRLLDALWPVREKVLLVDGNSLDETVSCCKQRGFKIIQSAPGRARQMNCGARCVGEAKYLWFLHADCLPPAGAIAQIVQYCQRGYLWGRFDVRLSGERLIFRIIEKMMNWRSCMTQVATGDQGIFVSRALFEEVGGFPDIPLMEDVAMSKLLRQRGRGACSRVRIKVSSRRWESQGVLRTILLMWWLRLRYVFGSDPADLCKAYYG